MQQNRSDGARITTASSGLAQYRGAPAQSPLMDWRKCCSSDRARDKWPGLKVLYTTGYTRNAIVRNGVLYPGTSILTKLAWRTLLPRFARYSMSDRVISVSHLSQSPARTCA